MFELMLSAELKRVPACRVHLSSVVSAFSNELKYRFRKPTTTKTRSKFIGNKPNHKTPATNFTVEFISLSISQHQFEEMPFFTRRLSLGDDVMSMVTEGVSTAHASPNQLSPRNLILEASCNANNNSSNDDDDDQKISTHSLKNDDDKKNSTFEISISDMFSLHQMPIGFAPPTHHQASGSQGRGRALGRAAHECNTTNRMKNFFRAWDLLCLLWEKLNMC